MENHTIPKEDITEKLFEKYNPESIGQIEKYPPKGEYFVTLYFEDCNFTMSSRYNVKVNEELELYDFHISNIAKVDNETNVTVKIIQQ